MNSADIQLVRNGFAAIMADRDGFAAAFYERLFALDPSLRALFATDMRTQGTKLLGALSHVVRSLDKLDGIIAEVRALARRHVAYGVEREHYDLVGEALMGALAARLGQAFDEGARTAWRAAYAALAGAMIDASSYPALKQSAA
ncbi:MAG TPA: globin domain-containing protein [Beijerinckiaceae bacterium]|jgi:hemoglobin-like flavoprotein